MSAKNTNNQTLLFFNGLIAILYGILALFVPNETLLTVIVFFGIAIFVFGVIMLISAINKIRNNIPYIRDFIWSVMVIIIGGLLVFNTQRSVEIFVVVIGAWAIMLGIGQLLMLMQKNLTQNEKHMLILNGVVSLIFGIILFFNPFDSAKFLVILTGILAFFIGILLIILGLKIKEVVSTIESKEE